MKVTQCLHAAFQKFFKGNIMGIGELHTTDCMLCYQYIQEHRKQASLGIFSPDPRATGVFTWYYEAWNITG